MLKGQEKSLRKTENRKLEKGKSPRIAIFRQYIRDFINKIEKSLKPEFWIRDL